jgi:GNAT superfamily N-acetyltransferase
MAADQRDLLLRVADAGDARAIATLRSLWSSSVSADRDFEGRMADWMATESGRRTIWLAIVRELPVGMASLFEYQMMPRPERPNSRWGYVSNLFVREEFRNRGIGSALLNTIITTSDERSYARLVVLPRANRRFGSTGGQASSFPTTRQARIDCSCAPANRDEQSASHDPLPSPEVSAMRSAIGHRRGPGPLSLCLLEQSCVARRTALPSVVQSDHLARGLSVARVRDRATSSAGEGGSIGDCSVACASERLGETANESCEIAQRQQSWRGCWISIKAARRPAAATASAWSGEAAAAS